MLLAKKFAVMFKNYRKFCSRYLGFDPLLKMVATREEIKEELKDNEAILNIVNNPEDVSFKNEESKQDPLPEQSSTEN